MQTPTPISPINRPIPETDATVHIAAEVAVWGFGVDCAAILEQINHWLSRRYLLSVPRIRLRTVAEAMTIMIKMPKTVTSTPTRLKMSSFDQLGAASLTVGARLTEFGVPLLGIGVGNAERVCMVMKKKVRHDSDMLRRRCS